MVRNPVRKHRRKTVANETANEKTKRDEQTDE